MSIDVGNKGYLNANDLSKFMGISQRDAQQIIKSFENRDDTMTYHGFCQLTLPETNKKLRDLAINRLSMLEKLNNSGMTTERL